MLKGKESMSHGLPCVIDGWFAVAYSHELAPGALRVVDYMGRPLVVYRTCSGRIAAADAHCPHLGAAFATMGRVEGEQLVCGAHGFRFDERGSCAHAYGRAANNVRLGTRHVREQLGVVFVWYQRNDAAPSWELPTLHEQGWSPARPRFMQLATHPQEIVENAVDVGHFEGVHGLTESTPSALETDGHRLSTRGTFTSRAVGPFSQLRVQVDFRFDAFGLGLARSEASIAGLGLRLRAYAAATPRADGTSDLRCFTQVHDAPGFVARVPVLGRVVPRALACAALGGLWSAVFGQDFAKDVVYWTSKRYLPRPALGRLDVYIGPYRKWVQQFYHDSTTVLGTARAEDNERYGSCSIGPERLVGQSRTRAALSL